MRKSVVIVNTGNGKGKTTAAFGQAFRVAGHGDRVCIIQFIKGKWQTGEAKAAKAHDLIEIHVCGTGFTWDADDKDSVKDAGSKGWQLAREKIGSGKFRLVVLDEITYLLNYGIITEDEFINMIQTSPEGVDIVITGRDASQIIIDTADIVTEMVEVKHPYRNGIEARKGVEF